MFLTSASQVLRTLRASTGSDDALQAAIRRAYLKYVLDIHDAGEPHDAAEKLIDQRLAAGEQPPSSDGFGADKTLRLFWRLSNDKERFLISDLMTRRYYKRIIEIPLSEFVADDWIKIAEIFRSSAKRLELRDRIELAFVNTLTTAIQSQSPTRESLVVDRAYETTRKIAAQRFGFLVDLPTRGWTAGGDDPIFVQDYKRRHFRSIAGAPASGRRPTIWSDHIAPMMRKVAVFRIFCEPDLHRILTRVLDPSDVIATTKDILQEYKLKFQPN
jgi:hypothetical protein